jgi:hypothetical protein
MTMFGREEGRTNVETVHPHLSNLVLLLSGILTLYILTKPTVYYDRRPVGHSFLVSSPKSGFCYYQTVEELLMWSALFDENTGLSFTISSGPRQRSHS